jgi:hypothetical protein
MSHQLPDEHLTMTFEIIDDDDRKIGLKAFGNSIVNITKTLDESILGMK